MLIRVLDLPRFIEIDLKPDKKLRQGFNGAPTTAAGSQNKEQVLLLDCSPGGGELVPYIGEGGVCLGVGLEE